jgi:glycerophosphoryl diester phosphodiesterase
MPKSFWGDTPIAIAHRGGDGAGFAKRNTMAAFKTAAKQGYEYFETDVVVTKDSKVIISHGAQTGLSARLRGTHSYNLLQGATYKEVKRSFKVGGEEIILLEDLLKEFPKARFLIDPKTDEAVAPLAELVLKLKVLDRVCLGSFRYKRVERLDKILKGKAHLGLIIGRNNWLKYLPMLKTNRLKHIEAVYLHHSFVSQPMLGLIHHKGFKALIWTANSPLSIKNALRCGADGIISDRVTLLKETLDK